jgi:hypothetical protein
VNRLYHTSFYLVNQAVHFFQLFFADISASRVFFIKTWKVLTTNAARRKIFKEMRCFHTNARSATENVIPSLPGDGQEKKTKISKYLFLIRGFSEQ